MIIINPYRFATGTSYDTDAQAFFDRVTGAGGSLSNTEKSAVNQLVLDLKGYGIWSKRKVIYPFVGASAAAFAQNLASSSFTGTFSSGFTYATTGLYAAGNGYMSTGFKPLTEGLSYNNNSIGFYSRTAGSPTPTSYYDAGSGTSTGAGNYDIWCRRNGNTTGYDSADASVNRASTSNTDGSGFFLGTASGSTAKLFRNGTLMASTSVSNVAISDYQIYVNAFNEGNTGTVYYSEKENALFWAGLGLTDTEAGNLRTAVQAFQTTLSRQV